MKLAKEKDTTYLTWALFYAREKHWPVFPITAGQKKPPLVKNGLLDATLDEKKITEWWTRWPDANIAIRTGVECFVFDKDAKGEHIYEQLIHQHGPLRNTQQATTPNDGRHWFFAKPPNGDKIGTHAPARDDWGEGIDVRGEGGYVLVHPSIITRKADGKRRRYEWDGLEGELDAVNPADPWLIEALREGGSRDNGKRAHFEVPEGKIPHGQQHDRLVSMAGRMRYAGGGYDEILAALLAFNTQRCTIPGPPEDIDQYARSVCQYPPGDRNALPKDEGKPLVLPEALSVPQMLDLDVSPPEILIESLLPKRGATLLQGPQKVGKTIFAAQAAIALATNHPLLEYFAIKTSGPVIIVEQDDPAGDATFKDIYLRAKVPRTAPIHFHRRAPVAFCEAFIEWLEREITKHQAVLVVLDSYTALRPSRKGGGDIVKDESTEITQLDTLGKRLNCLILLLHHESTTGRAANGLDWDAKGAGTFAITAASESQISVGRYRDLPINFTERLIRVRGRHLSDYEFTARLNRESMLYDWVLDGGAAPLYPLIADVKREIHTDEFTHKDYEEAVGVSRATAFRQLSMLLQCGALWKDRGGRGTYRLSPEIARVNL
jgi:hypothetical protein